MKARCCRRLLVITVHSHHHHRSTEELSTISGLLVIAHDIILWEMLIGVDPFLDLARNGHNNCLYKIFLCSVLPGFEFRHDSLRPPQWMEKLYVLQSAICGYSAQRRVCRVFLFILQSAIGDWSISVLTLLTWSISQSCFFSESLILRVPFR